MSLLAAAGFREFGDVVAGAVAFGGRGLGKHDEGFGEQRVAAQHGHALAIDLVAGRPAAAQVIVVHGGQIVMDERVGVHQLDRAGRGEGVGQLAAAGLGGGEAEHGPQAFAAGEHGVAHRRVDRRRAFLRLRQKRVHRRIHFSGAGGEIGFEGHRMSLRILAEQIVAWKSSICDP